VRHNIRIHGEQIPKEPGSEPSAFEELAKRAGIWERF